MRLAAEARGEIRHRSDRAVVPPALEADRADRGIAARDADAEAEVPATLAPAGGQLLDAIAHRDRHADRALRGVRHLDGIVEKDHHAVAGEPLERSFLLVDQAAHSRMVIPKHPQDL